MVEGPQAANAWGCMKEDRPRRLNSGEGALEGSFPPTRVSFVRRSEGVVEKVHLVVEMVGVGRWTTLQLCL